MLDRLVAFQKEVDSLAKGLSAEPRKTINKKSLRELAMALSQCWLKEIVPELEAAGPISKDAISKRSTAFLRLAKLSGPSNLKSSYVECLSSIRKKFREDLIVPIQVSPRSAPKSKILDFIFEGVDETESDYLKEALSCAKSGYFRASVVLGWCACINRIHKKLENLGFAKFNTASIAMSQQTAGRFKRFNKSQSVTSLSELRSVFDNDILWIIEGMQLIDSNQHTRLAGCLDMRHHSAHPGEAPITEYNLASFFSDINAIIFKNENFKLN